MSAFEYAWSLLKALPEQQYYGHPFANLDYELLTIPQFWGDHPKGYWTAGEGDSYGTMHPVIQRLVREGAHMEQPRQSAGQDMIYNPESNPYGDAHYGKTWDYGDDEPHPKLVDEKIPPHRQVAYQSDMRHIESPLSQKRSKTLFPTE